MLLGSAPCTWTCQRPIWSTNCLGTPLEVWKQGSLLMKLCMTHVLFIARIHVFIVVGVACPRFYVFPFSGVFCHPNQGTCNVYERGPQPKCAQVQRRWEASLLELAFAYMRTGLRMPWCIGVRVCVCVCLCVCVCVCVQGVNVYQRKRKSVYECIGVWVHRLLHMCKGL